MLVKMQGSKFSWNNQLLQLFFNRSTNRNVDKISKKIVNNQMIALHFLKLVFYFTNLVQRYSGNACTARDQWSRQHSPARLASWLEQNLDIKPLVLHSSSTAWKHHPYRYICLQVQSAVDFWAHLEACQQPNLLDYSKEKLYIKELIPWIYKFVFAFLPTPAIPPAKIVPKNSRVGVNFSPSFTLWATLFLIYS